MPSFSADPTRCPTPTKRVAASFAPDALFLKRFRALSDTKAMQVIGPSLANKRYYGFTMVDNTTSPLEFLAKLVKVEDDINSRATIIRVHDYHFRNPVYNGMT